MKCFYRNFSFDRPNCCISSYIKRKIIEFDCSFFYQILDIPSYGDKYFNSIYWSHPDLGYHACIKIIFEDDSLG